MNSVFIQLCKQMGLPKPEEEFVFSERKFRFDYAFVDKKVAVEQEGGIWTRSGHSHPTGIIRDMEKYNLAASLGWRVLRVQPKDLLKAETFDLIKKTLN